MKVAIIWSSPNKDGLTNRAAMQMKRGLEKTGVEVEEIVLNKKKIEACKACGNGWGKCRENGMCILPDDFANVYESLKNADGIVFVSAVYWSEMTECMKAFIDRLRRCEATHNHFLAEKRCMLVACAGGTGRGTIECLKQMEQALVHMSMRAYDRIPVNRFNSEYMLDALEKAGEVYADKLENGFDMYY
ncbi:MAG: flavodoxin family protein [Lachnospiraceae bacterium]|nr:flavodoxin family protein [Lachnospiraceae bacterium]